MAIARNRDSIPTKQAILLAVKILQQNECIPIIQAHWLQTKLAAATSNEQIAEVLNQFSLLFPKSATNVLYTINSVDSHERGSIDLSLEAIGDERLDIHKLPQHLLREHILPLLTIKDFNALLNIKRDPALYDAVRTNILDKNHQASHPLLYSLPPTVFDADGELGDDKCMTLLSDGTILTSGQSECIRAWEINTATLQCTCTEIIEWEDYPLDSPRIRTTALPDKQFISFIGRTIKVWCKDVTTQQYECTQTLDIPEAVIRTIFSIDSTHIAVGLSDGDIVICQKNTGSQLFEIQQEIVDHLDRVHSILNLSNGKLLSADLNQIRIWHKDPNTQQYALEQTINESTAISSSPPIIVLKGGRVVIRDQNYIISIWEEQTVETRREYVAIPKPNQAAIFSMAPLENGGLIANNYRQTIICDNNGAEIASPSLSIDSNHPWLVLRNGYIACLGMNADESPLTIYHFPTVREQIQFAKTSPAFSLGPPLIPAAQIKDLPSKFATILGYILTFVSLCLLSYLGVATALTLIPYTSLNQPHSALALAAIYVELTFISIFLKLLHGNISTINLFPTANLLKAIDRLDENRKKPKALLSLMASMVGIVLGGYLGKNVLCTLPTFISFAAIPYTSLFIYLSIGCTLGQLLSGYTSKINPNLGMLLGIGASAILYFANAMLLGPLPIVLPALTQAVFFSAGILSTTLSFATNQAVRAYYYFRHGHTNADGLAFNHSTDETLTENDKKQANILHVAPQDVRQLRVSCLEGMRELDRWHFIYSAEEKQMGKSSLKTIYHTLMSAKTEPDTGHLRHLIKATLPAMIGKNNNQMNYTAEQLLGNSPQAIKSNNALRYLYYLRGVGIFSNEHTIQEKIKPALTGLLRKLSL